MTDKDKEQPNIEQEDLDLVDDSLEDEGKDEAALWSEFDAEESGQKAATDDGTGEGEGGDDAAAADAGSDDDAAAAAGDDAGESGSDDDSAAPQPSGSDQDPAGKSDDGGKAPASDDGRAQADEVWANATPEQKAAYDAAQKELKRLEHAERSNRGRISAMQRQIAELTGGQRPSQPQQADSQGSADGQGQGAGDGSDQGTDDGFLKSEDWQSFRQEYPEVAGPLEKVIGTLQSEVTRQHKELAAIGEDRRQSALSEQAELLAEEHSDWQEVVADDSFGEWLEAQPRHIREAAVRNADDIVDAQEAADVVGRFKAFQTEQQGGGNAQQQDASRSEGDRGNNQQARRQRQLESASTARSRGPGVATGIPEDGDPERIWKQFDEMEKRQAGGGA